MRKWTHLVVLLAGGAAAADEMNHDTTPSRLRLRPEVSIAAAPARLGDVLDLSGADARLVATIAAQPVADATDGESFDITHAQVTRRLAALGVNPADVLLAGAATCRVTVVPPRELPPPSSDAGTVLAGGRAGEVGPRTLADAVRTQLQRELARDGGSLDLQFERGAEHLLTLTTPPYDFVIRSAGNVRQLGPRELKVTVRRDGQTLRSEPVFVKARLVRPVVVARRPLNRGGFVRPDDVVLEERVFDRLEDVGLVEVGEVIGQQVERAVLAGGMVRRGDLKAVDLVRASRPVTVLGGAAGISAQVTGTAVDSGTYGDTVWVRLGNAPRDRRTVRGVVEGIATVRLVEP